MDDPRDLPPIIALLVGAYAYLHGGGDLAVLRSRLAAVDAAGGDDDALVAACRAMVDAQPAGLTAARAALDDAVTASCRQQAAADPRPIRRVPGLRPPRGGSGRRRGSYVARTVADDADDLLGGA